MTQAPPAERPLLADRVPAVVRWPLILLLIPVCAYFLGAITGSIVAIIEGAPVTARRAGRVGAFLLGVAASGGLLWLLTAPLRRASRSRFEKRYTRMWVLLIVISLPLGMILAGAVMPQGEKPDLFSNAPLPAASALLAAAALLVTMVLAALLYHRTIDDHEEHATLWGSTVAFYFLIVALPVAWLLARGGLIAPVDITTAMLILLASLILQGLVWLWIKYR